MPDEPRPPQNGQDPAQKSSKGSTQDIEAEITDISHTQAISIL